MISIMDNRKRPRFEMIHVDNINSNESMQGVASTANTLGTATLATIGGQSYILSNSTTSIPANILLSICDDNSDETEEYILDHSMLTSIKQEQTVSTQTTNNPNPLQQTNLVTTAPQYRIVNQTGKSLNTSPLNHTMINSTAVNANSLNSLNLPPGCEVYVIKEVFDSPKQVIAESTTVTTTSPKVSSASATTIKLEPISSLPMQRRSVHNGGNTQNLNSTITINTTSPVTSTSNTSTNTTDDTVKRSLILEAYKKRDDKRRATHNEVERRRRDKINSWIFKLKEMLPSEVMPCNSNSSSSTLLNNHNNSANHLFVQQQGTANSTRTPPSDSKSQILIKACEYIKSMKAEINSLRECLTENENLRLKNQRLQEEINNLRNKQQQQHKFHNNNNLLLTTNTTNSSNNSSHNSDNSDSCEITLNSLNTTYANVQLFTPSTNQHNHHHLVDLVGLTTSNAATSTSNSVNVKYAKRELIITDYVD